MGNYVDPVYVVHVAVAIVVNSVAGNLRAVDPQVVHQVFVGEPRAAVRHGHDDGGGVRLDVPAFGCVDVGIDSPAALAGVVQTPLLAEARIVGSDQRFGEQ